MQRAVFTCLELFEHAAFAAHLDTSVVGSLRLVAGILPFGLQLVDFYQIALTAVSVGDIDDDKQHDEQQQPYLAAYGRGVEDVATHNLAEGERTR